MSGNTLGTLFTVTTFGESHGPAIGCVVDGCPPGMALSEADIQPDLDRRKPGTSRHVTQRREEDRVEILSGVFEGRTTGTPIALLIRNEDQRSKDYAKIASSFRPGHADYTYLQKYGLRDPRGGGRSSARLTAPAVAAGAIARKWLRERYGVEIRGHLTHLGPNAIPFESWDARRTRTPSSRPTRRSCRSSRPTWTACASRATPAERGSRVVAAGAPPGWGEPLYGRLDADIAQAMMGINAVKGVEIGAGFAAAAQMGTEHSDEMSPGGLPLQPRGRDPRRASRRARTSSSRSRSSPPRASASRAAPSTWRASRRRIETHGRHDPCVGIRATPIAEAFLALVLADHALRHRAQNADVACATPRIPARGDHGRRGPRGFAARGSGSRGGVRRRRGSGAGYNFPSPGRP